MPSNAAFQKARKPTHSSATITTINTQLKAANTARHGGLVINNGAFPVYLKVDGSTAVANEGILLKAGGHYYFSIETGNNTYEAINGIAVGGSSKLLLTEWYA